MTTPCHFYSDSCAIAASVDNLEHVVLCAKTSEWCAVIFIVYNKYTGGMILYYIYNVH